MLRITSVVVGVALIAGVIWLGTETGKNQSLLVWFALGTGILIPLGLAMIGFGFSGSDRVLFRRLAKVPEVDGLIKEAKSQEERIQVLQEERAKLVQVVEFEARKEALVSRRAAAEDEAVRIVRQLEDLDAKLAQLDMKIAASPLSEDVQRLHDRVAAKRKRDVVFHLGGKEFVIRRDLVLHLPAGPILIMYVDFVRKVVEIVLRFVGGNGAFEKREGEDI